MKLNKVSVSSSNLKLTLHFYSILGFMFSETEKDAKHIESVPNGDEAALMIDTDELIAEISGSKPSPGSHSAFAIEYDSKEEVDKLVSELKESNFAIVKEPWEAFWGQYYCIVADPDGYNVDLYVNL